MIFSRGVEQLLAVFEQRLEKIEQNQAKTADLLMKNNNVLLNALLQAQDKILALSGDSFLKLKTPEIAQAQYGKPGYEGPAGEILKIPAVTDEERIQRTAAINEMNAIITGARDGYD